jgi:processive 1,2-diacylglycerol beta-glucosyltransferase/1,2-diacylglycerol 3-beta-galactosyltransferase
MHRYGDTVETMLIDGLEGTRSIARFVIEDGYRILQSRAKWLYEAIYALNKIPWNAKWDAWLASIFIKPILKRRILAERPTKIVVLHFLLIKPTRDVLRESRLDIPVIIVVTDPFTAHKMWFLRKDQRFVVFSERLKAHCEALGIAGERLAVFPFVLSTKFSAGIPRDQITAVKQRLGFNPSKKLVLILGGGDGIPRGAAILRRLIHHVPDAEYAIVCGRNKGLLLSAQELRRRSQVHLEAYGYVDNVHELISISDVVISKGGASTCMEVLMLKKIPVVTDYIWEQERGNVEFLTENAIGFYEPHLKNLPTLVQRVLTDDKFRNSYLANIGRMQLRSGTADVARWVVDGMR